MANANPTRPNAPSDEKSLDGGTDLLDPALDDAIGDRAQGGRIFSDDVRSDEIGGIPDRNQ